jgi:hypothetical protein
VNEQILALLNALDAALTEAAPGRHLDLYHLGRSALVLHYNLDRVTKDMDILMMRTPLETRAVELFGKGTENAARLGLYLETVPQGLPPATQWFCGRCTRVPGNWRVLRLWRPEPHDLAATKLKSYRPRDREDLTFLCDRKLLDAAKLRESLESAFCWSMEKDGDAARDRAFANLERVVLYLQGKSRTL